MYRKILVPVDGSEASTLGLREAAKLAKACGATLKAIHVVNDLVLVNTAYFPQSFYDQTIAALRQGGKKVLESAQATARANAAELQVELLDTIGGPADQIIEHAKTWGADLIVMGTHGRRGLRRLALGSDAEMVLRASPVPVLFVRGKAEG
jgi:nucleotide-binding universal stress UspA family protein